MLELIVSSIGRLEECRMPKLRDLTGQKFGRLTVVRRAKNSAKCETMWECICDCGNYTIVRGKNLTEGITKSCGCIRKDPRPYRRTHGMSRTRLYRIWSLIKDRCENKNNPAYERYGGRGIRLCDEWHSSSSFFDWALNNGYSENLTIDRIDNDGDYCPENCRWADIYTQSNNTRRNRYMTLNGKTQTLAEWCTEYDMPYKTVHSRLNRQRWDLEKALTTPIDKRKTGNKFQS